MCHLVGISHHYKIVFMSSTTLCRAVSRARTCFAAVYLWVILPSGISSDCRCPLDVAGRKLCVKWKMNILVTFCINFATRSASRYSLFQVWNVRKICQQSQRTGACRTSHHKLAHCEGLATFGNSKLSGWGWSDIFRTCPGGPVVRFFRERSDFFRTSIVERLVVILKTTLSPKNRFSVVFNVILITKTTFNAHNN